MGFSAVCARSQPPKRTLPCRHRMTDLWPAASSRGVSSHPDSLLERDPPTRPALFGPTCIAPTLQRSDEPTSTNGRSASFRCLLRICDRSESAQPDSGFAEVNSTNAFPRRWGRSFVTIVPGARSLAFDHDDSWSAVGVDRLTLNSGSSFLVGGSVSAILESIDHPRRSTFLASRPRWKPTAVRSS